LALALFNKSFTTSVNDYLTRAAMDIAFTKSRLEKCANQHSHAQTEFGPIRAKRFLARLTEMRAADCLADLRNVPQAAYHELTGDRKGEIACNLDHPYRLIFVPAHFPIPRKPDGGLDWDGVTAVQITEIVNYHG
jgi:proteic killer suppression protein